MTKYTPDYTHLTVRKRIESSLDWVNTYLSVNNDKWLSTREIQRQLGSQSRDLGKWLRFKLLICVNSYYNPLNKTCKTYRLNLEGYNEICAAIGYEPKFKPSQAIMAQVNTGDFEYTESSDRLFNPIQFVPKKKRNAFLCNNGYKYNYDIEAAAPTLILQQAHRYHKNQHKKKPLLTPHLENYVNDRTTVRNQIALECGCTSDQIKTLVNALLQGGKLSSWSNNKTFQDLGSDYDLLKRLQNNKTLCDIRKDISSCWEVLKGDISVGTITDLNGRTRRRALSGGDKSGYYRFLEKQVGDVIRKTLKKDNNWSLWIHDGWCCQRIVDDVELISEVKRQTGFVIKLSSEEFE